MNLNEDNERLIETLFRNGTLAVVGIVPSFSLGFLSQWANNPLLWNWVDALPVLFLCAGVVRYETLAAGRAILLVDADD